MVQRRIVIGVADGLHARPVAELARLAQEHPVPVMLTTAQGERVELSSVLAVMDLGLRPGDEVVLQSEGPDATAMLDAMAAVLAPES